MITLTDSKKAKQPSLTPTQVEILAGYARGERTKSLAEQLNLSVSTIDYHTRKLALFFHTHARPSMVFLAVIGGILTQEWPPESTGQFFMNLDSDPGS